MPKQPEITELCRIHADTTLDQMGHVLAALARMGLANVGYELVTEVATFKKKQTHEIKAEDFAAAWIKDHPTFKATELVNHFDASGRTSGAAYTALRKLVDRRTLKQLGSGNYQHADIKAIEGPKKHGADAGLTNRDFIWKVIGRRKSFMASELTQAFKEAGRQPSSMTSVLAKLVGSKELKLLGGGQYAVLGRKSEPTPPTTGKRPPVTHRYEVSNKDFLMKRIGGRSKVSVKEMEEVFTAEKRNPHSVSALFAMLSQPGGMLTKHGEIPGLYLVSKKITPPPPPANNGNGHDVSEASHG
jgi:hypothetical protein